jgi:hypothetical protein
MSSLLGDGVVGERGWRSAPGQERSGDPGALAAPWGWRGGHFVESAAEGPRGGATPAALGGSEFAEGRVVGGGD